MTTLCQSLLLSSLAAVAFTSCTSSDQNSRSAVVPSLALTRLGTLGQPEVQKASRNTTRALYLSPDGKENFIIESRPSSFGFPVFPPDVKNLDGSTTPQVWKKATVQGQVLKYYLKSSATPQSHPVYETAGFQRRTASDEENYYRVKGRSTEARFLTRLQSLSL